MRSFLLYFLIFLAPSVVKCQWSDDFSDGDFSQNPPWTGNDSNFVVDQNALRLFAPAKTDTAFMAVPSNIGINASWRGTVRLDFNPSSQNFVQIFLMSDHKDLRRTQQGYFLLIGGTNDNVSLYKRTSGASVKLIEGRHGILHKTSNALNFWVSRSATNDWVLKTDTGSNAFVEEGAASDQSILTSAYFGLTCHYTATRSTKMYFDNFTTTGDVFRDTIPPILIFDRISDSKTWNLFFSEPLDSLRMLDSQFELNGSNKNIIGHHFVQKQHKLSILFESSLPHGTILTLRPNTLYDTAGNVFQEPIIEGLFTNSDSLNPKDVIFNELMIDPSPAITLPNTEYIEIFNASDWLLNLNKWMLTDQKDTCVMPNYLMHPGEILCLVDSSKKDQWPLNTNVIFVNNLPTLNNDEDALLLLDYQMKVIDSLNYKSSWHSDGIKKEGGWSLELCNPNFKCHDANNWKSSKDSTGGTPGLLNSTFVDSMPHFSLKGQIFNLDSAGIEIALNEKTLTPPKEWHIAFDPFNSVQKIVLVADLFKLQFSNISPPGNSTTLSLSNLFDCFGRPQEPIDIQYVIPEKAHVGDVLINEILFNPYPLGSDFLEVYNASSKTIDFKNWKIGSLDENSSPTEFEISDHYFPLKPQAYLALTPDTDMLKQFYPQRIDSAISYAELPKFNDDQGHVYLKNAFDEQVDELFYHEDMHFPLLENKEGVSLERISPWVSGHSGLNWHSAASGVDYATPGYQNSHFKPSGAENKAFYATPDIFSPDNDGYKDVSTFNYEINASGFMGKVQIYNLEGRCVRHLADNQLLSSKGSFIWDGFDDRGQKCAIGYYIVMLDAFNANGQIHQFKSTVVLAHFMP